MLRILHLADLHLGWDPPFLGPAERARREERDSLLDRAAEYALSRQSGIQAVFIAGDLFETHTPPPALLERVLAALRRLEAAGIACVTVPGNHDEITYPNSVYRQAPDWPGVLVTNPNPARVTTLSLAGTDLHLYSLAYTGGLTRPVEALPREEAPGLHVGIFHGTVGTRYLGDRSLPLPEEALSVYHYAALGHIHQHLAFGRAVYCGAVEGKTFDDPGTGSFTVVDLDERGFRLKQVEAGARPMQSRAFDLGQFDGPAELEEAIAALANPELMLEVRLTGTAAFPVDPVALQARLAGRFWHLSLTDETAALPPDRLERWALETTIRGQFVRRLLARLAQAGAEERPVLQRALRAGLAALSRGDAR